MDISVVIGSNSSPAILTSCLEALEPQSSGIEVLVYESKASPPLIKSRFGWARFVEVPGALVPHLWTGGIEQSTGDIVALTISTMIPAPDWIEAIRRHHLEHDVVAGAIDPGPSLRPSDWAEYLCRYSPDMLPFDPH